MNSPYCCLMEMGTQTNEQPLPGSAPRVLINPDAATLMALIFQTKRWLRLTASRHSHNKREFQSGTKPKGKEVVVFMPHLVCWARSLPVGNLPLQFPICDYGEAQSDAGVMRVSASVLKGCWGGRHKCKLHLKPNVFRMQPSFSE